MGDEIKTDTEDTGKPGDEQKGTTSQEGGETTQTHKTYSQQEVDVISAAVGKKLKEQLVQMTTERDTLKTQAEATSAEVAQTKADIEALNEEIGELSKDDPDKIELVKLRNTARARLKAIEAKESELSVRETVIQKLERDQLVYQVADEFVTGSGKDVDFDSFMAAANRFKVNDREGLVALAEEKGFKPKPEEDNTPPDSGKNKGGDTDLSHLSGEELLRVGFKKSLSRK